MRGHVDAESLARCAEGLLSRARAMRIRAHLARCPQCAAEQARLTAVTVLLSEVPAAPLPDFVAARLDVALSAESARRAAQPAAAAEPGPTGQPAAPTPPAAPAPPAAGGPDRRPGHRRAGRGWRWPPLPAPLAARGLAAAAVLVVLAGAGYGLAQVTSSTSGSSSTASSASGSSASRGSGSALGKTHEAPPKAGPGAPSNSPPASGRTVIARSGRDYRKGTLGAQAAAVFGQRSRSQGAVTPGPLVGTPQDLGPCVMAVAGRQHVSMVDHAYYRGKPALIIVLGTPPAVVYAAQPGCSSARGILGHAVLK
jgi:hypothetical protein